MPDLKTFFLLSILFLCCHMACITNPYRDGEALYKRQCANCHQDNGRGLGALIPPLDSADYLGLHRDKLPCIIRYGLQDSIVVNGQGYTGQMPGAATLSDIDVTNILNYVNTAWGNQYSTYKLDEVRALLEQCSACK
jgi:mono/diheme cytochrome c family protein